MIGNECITIVAICFYVDFLQFQTCIYIYIYVYIYINISICQCIQIYISICIHI